MGDALAPEQELRQAFNVVPRRTQQGRIELGPVNLRILPVADLGRQAEGSAGVQQQRHVEVDRKAGGAGDQSERLHERSSNWEMKNGDLGSREPVRRARMRLHGDGNHHGICLPKCTYCPLGPSLSSRAMLTLVLAATGISSSPAPSFMSVLV